jgi:hypothetical protein
MRWVTARAAALGTVLTALTVLIGGPAAAGPAHAAAGGWWVQPAARKGDTGQRQYFVLEGRPGSTLRDDLALTNDTDKNLTFDLFGADAYNTPRDGQFALRGYGTAMTDVGSWVKTAFPSISVPAHTATVVPVTIDIPENATPGDHVGGVSARDTQPEGKQQQGDVVVDIMKIVSARLYLHVDGNAVGGLTVTGLRLSASSPFPAYLSNSSGTVQATVTNTGNLLQTPKAHLRATGLFGTLIDRTVQLPQILPGQSVDFSQAWKDVPPFELGTLRLDVTDGTAAPPVTSSASVSLTMIPWYSLLVLLLLITAAVVGARFWRRRTRSS